MNFTRRWAACLLATLAMAGTAFGQAPRPADAGYPKRAIRLIVPFPAGGPSDVLARVFGEKLAARLHQSVVVDNRPGGNTIIGASAVTHAAPDGYTLLLAIDNTLVMNQYLYSDLPYDPLTAFEPIGKLAVAPLIVMTSAEGPKTMEDLVKRAKADPARVSYGFGTFTSQLAGELLKQSLGAEVQAVPYKGSPGTVQGLLTRDVDFIIDGTTSAQAFLRSGKFRPLASLGRRPVPNLPDLPLIGSAGIPGIDVEVWLGLVAPRGVSPEIVNLLSQAAADIFAMPDVKARIAESGMVPDVTTPAQFKEMIRTDAAKWKAVIAKAGIKVQ